jgi:hypothetical protein
LVLLVVSALDWCWLQRLYTSLLHVIYHKNTTVSQYINAMHGV